MKQKTLRFLNWLIWIVEGNAFRYYRYYWNTFWAFTVPNMMSDLQLRFGLRQRLYTNIGVMTVALRGEAEAQIATQAMRELREEKFIKNQKKAHLSMERYSRGGGRADVKGEEALDHSVKLTREEKFYSDHSGSIKAQRGF